MRTKTLDIRLPIFTAAQASMVSGCSLDVLKIWARRGLISKPKREDARSHARQKFSVVTIFELTVMRLLQERLDIGPTGATSPTSEVVSSGEIASKISNDGWMWAVARRTEAGGTLPILISVGKVGNEWEFRIDLGDVSIGKTPFETDSPFIVLPVGPIFSTVYVECKKLLGGNKLRNRSGA